MCLSDKHILRAHPPVDLTTMSRPRADGYGLMDVTASLACRGKRRPLHAPALILNGRPAPSRLDVDHFLRRNADKSILAGVFEIAEPRSPATPRNTWIR